MAGQQRTVRVGGRKLKLTSLDKVLYPEAGTTKAEVIEYLQTVASAMLPHVRRRPVTRKRWPDGTGTAGEPGDSFFRKNLEESAPEWVPRLRQQHGDHANTYPLAEDKAVLAWFGQVAALELHVPQWRFDADVRPFIPQDDEGEPPVAEPRNPDRLVLDLDPGPGVELAGCARVARWCREILDGMGLPSVPLTSGSKGIHLYAELDGSYTSDDVSKVAKELARTLESEQPDLVISQMKRAERRDKVFLDWSQNNASKTTVAPYSLRGRSRPWVAAPRTWDELDDEDLRQLDFREVMERLAGGNDPLAGFGRYTHEGEADVAEVAKPSPGGRDERVEIDDALTKYRSMRDATKTDEPVPASAPKARDDDPIFVIQEHHATALHFDTRLERDGVLVSWAVPKGPPLEQGVQRLAVHTEDHPFEYATFEGTIPKGQYGAGEVKIWDSGTVDVESWKEEKIVFVLHGRPDGGLGGVPRRYVLVQTDDEGKDWLIRLMKRQPGAGKPEPAKSRKGGAAPAPKRLPSPMLATLGAPEDLRGDDWVYEAKWDGYRMIAAVREDGVELRSRKGEDYTKIFPEVAELVELAPVGTVVDGEIVALNGASRPDFGLLQQRGRLTKEREIKRMAGRIPVQYLLFDVLYTAEEGDVAARAYTERRELLQGAVEEGECVRVPVDLGTDLDAALEVSEELDLEGVLAKRAGAPYRAGRRSEDWVKIKRANHVDAVVIGWRRGKGNRAETFGSLLLAVPGDDGLLRYAGRVGTGFTDADLAELRRVLERLVRKTPPVGDVPEEDSGDATWVTPRLHAEVRHAGMTRDGRLRQPVWRTVKDEAE